MSTVDLNAPDAVPANQLPFLSLSNKWLVPVDGSAGSLLALSHAMYLLNQDSDELHILVVHSPHFMGEDQDKTRAHLARAAGLVNDQIKPGSNFKVEQHFITAKDAREAICNMAEDLNIDYIVMGSRGLGVLKSLVLGSVSSYVAAHAPCPVIITRDRKNKGDQSESLWK